MGIKGNLEYGEDELVEFYKRYSESHGNDLLDIGAKMLELLKMINEIFKTTQLWAYTSVDALKIQASDDFHSKVYITISSYGFIDKKGLNLVDYNFQYSIPAHKQPWKNAMVIGEAETIDEAKKMLLIAMKESEGWQGNKELEMLLKENGIK